MSSISLQFLNALKGSTGTPGVGASGSSSFTAALRHRRRQKDTAAEASPNEAAADAPLYPSRGDHSSSDHRPEHNGTDAQSRLHGQSQHPHRLLTAAASTLSVAASTAGTGGGSMSYGSFAPLAARLARAASVPTTSGMSASTSVCPEARWASNAATVDTTAVLDTVSEEAPPHVAVRYGDTIRLFAKSKYAATNASDAGGYVGTFEIGKRFLAPKSTSKQGELACVPPILKAGALLYRPSTFRIQSTSGLPAGTPVSYGDVVVLVDEHGRVWNNKIGVGPTTKNGYFGPREQHTPGEMFLALYQLRDDATSSGSESSDDDDSFLSFSSIARTTKAVAETTFGKPTQVELDLAAAALRTMGRVVYYGDRNVVLDVADSNRIRSKFNRVITHYRKSDAARPVQGGYLRCDGRGKTILFELHGAPLPTIESIDVSEAKPRHNSADDDDSSGGVDDDDSNTDGAASRSRRARDAALQLRLSLAGGASGIQFGQPVRIENLRRSSMLSVRFSDGGAVHIACADLTGGSDSDSGSGDALYRVVHGGVRPTRILVQLTRSRRRRGTVGFRETLRGTYKELFQLFGFVVVTYSSGAYLISHVFGSNVLLPAMYVGVASALAVFLIEVVAPGKIVASRRAAAAALELARTDDDAIGNWEFAILALEASESECVRSASLSPPTSTKRESVAALAVPRSFLVAENGNAAKAAERYEATLAWRQEVNADGILGVPQQHYDIIKANYKHYLHKQDKFGHPVYYEKMASINIKQLHKAGLTQDDLFRHYLFAMEFTLKYVANKYCTCDACASSDTQKLCIVLDARGIGMKDIGGEAFEFVRRCTGMMQKHYPQKSFKIFFVNVPSWFGMAWKGIKPLMNETTRAKTNIVTESDTPAALLEVIDAENLPVEYGGTCACPGGCDDNSTYQRLQRALVSSVLRGEPFDASAFDAARDDESSAECAASALPRVKAPDADALRELCLVDDAASLAESIPPGSFRDEILKAGFLLKRSLRHKHFNPIWRRQFFVLHPESLRFGKSPDSEIFQIVSFTTDTVVRKTTKQNNSFEVITPLMASNGHSLLLYAPTPTLLTEWVDAIGDAITKLAPMPLRSSASSSDEKLE